MFFVSDALLDQILTDDIPYGDATTALLGIEKVPGIVRCRPKAETTIAGVALAERLFTRVGLQTTCFHEEGDTVDAGTVILEGRGPAGAIHAVYKTAQNILEYASGIATRTHQMRTRSKSRKCRLSRRRDTQAFSGHQNFVALRRDGGRRRRTPHGAIRIRSRVRSAPRLHSGF